MRKRHGLLTERQLEVLRLRRDGLTQNEIAEMFGSTRQNISLIERRAKRNVALAEDTVRTYRELTKAAEVVIDPGTHRVDVPRIVIDAADEANVRLRANFTRIYDEISFETPESLEGTEVSRPIKVLILDNGDIEVVPTGKE